MSASDPAFPTTEKHGLATACVGLSQRELFAAMAMQGMLTQRSWHAELIAQKAVEHADALLAALAKKPSQTD